MATTITQSIVAKFAASGNTSFSASQGLWFGEIPANLPTPFLGVVHNGETFEYTGEKDYQAYGSFLFSIYTEGVAAAEALALTVANIFDAFITNWSPLNFTGGTMAKWSKTSYLVALEPMADVNARKVGRVDIGYEYEFNGVLP